MSQAYEALMNLTNDEVAVYSSTSISEGHIIIGHDRRITVPDSLKRIAVQYDHNVETVTFDCPRYWDEHDMSEMQVYINYLLPSGMLGSYIADNVTVDSNDDTMMHFDWTISNNITDTKGQLTFLVCVKAVDSEGNESVHWNSERNDEMYIAQGLEGAVAVADMHPDVITQLLTRMDAVEKVQDIAVSAAESATVSAESANSALTNVTAIQSKVTTDLGSVRRFKDAAAKSALDASTAAADQVGTKADAIVKTGEGESVIITDSSDDPLRGFRIMGRTEQFTTTGKNQVDMSEFEFDDSNYTHMLYADDKSAADFYNFLKAHPGENIMVSMETTGTASGVDIGSLRFYTTGNELICAIVPNVMHTIKTDMPETFTAAYIYGSTTGASVKNIQVEFGTEVTPYEPYTGAKPSPNPEYPQELSNIENARVTINGKNLFDMSKFTTSGNITVLADGTLSVSHYYNTTALTIRDLCPGLVSGMDCKIYLDTDGSDYIYVTKLGRIWNHNNVLTITDDILDSTICVYGKDGQTDGSTIIRKIWVVPQGLTSEYEGYKPSQSIEVPYTLRGIPVTQNGNYTDSDGQQWYCDEINFERGVFIQRCFLETLTFTPQTELDRYTATVSHRANASLAVDSGIPVICTIYQFNSLSGSGTPKVSGIRIASTSPTYAIAYYNGEAIDEATVLYPLETPIEIELTAEDLEAYKALHTNYPTTMIFNDRNAMMHVDYNVDTNTYIAEEIRKGIEVGTDGVLRYVGTALSVTPISEGSMIKTIRISTGDQIRAVKGVVAKYNGVAYVYDGSIWTSL